MNLRIEVEELRIDTSRNLNIEIDCEVETSTLIEEVIKESKSSVINEIKVDDFIAEYGEDLVLDAFDIEEIKSYLADKWQRSFILNEIPVEKYIRSAMKLSGLGNFDHESMGAFLLSQKIKFHDTHNKTVGVTEYFNRTVSLGNEFITFVYCFEENGSKYVIKGKDLIKYTDNPRGLNDKETEIQTEEVKMSKDTHTPVHVAAIKEELKLRRQYLIKNGYKPGELMTLDLRVTTEMYDDTKELMGEEPEDFSHLYKKEESQEEIPPTEESPTDVHEVETDENIEEVEYTEKKDEELSAPFLRKKYHKLALEIGVESADMKSKGWKVCKQLYEDKLNGETVEEPTEEIESVGAGDCVTPKELTIEEELVILGYEWEKIKDINMAQKSTLRSQKKRLFINDLAEAGYDLEMLEKLSIIELIKEREDYFNSDEATEEINDNSVDVAEKEPIKANTTTSEPVDSTKKVTLKESISKEIFSYTIQVDCLGESNTISITSWVDNGKSKLVSRSALNFKKRENALTHYENLVKLYTDII